MNIRHVCEQDDQMLADLILRIEKESDFMLYEGGERSLDARGINQKIKTVQSQENSTIIVAEDDSKLIGYVMAMGGLARRNRHSAYLVAGLLKDYRNKGIGTKMFQTLLSWAQKKGLHRLELTVIAHNDAAIALYKKMGFKVEGVKRDSLWISGKYVDEYYMARLL
ncbi:acetyltransferase (GNAT) family protein [Melghiribacillus thermohalophilus]|uniref:Acetyltransferase (GNAT) family protein n=1 Tax=Melghiribacillus thermohalophilus TaxID=1324956 RepID=A0A4R3N0B5_9BACI|nr:GNAT family N-acetyltransferase [Melghiribacillus thermohalophilus]TCT20039.1 acetyltransferase (GNAT) family protein [Melghiribacillus thermohalophilus]